MPRVSIVIPTCNRPDLLPRAIRSVLAQTFQDFEIIIVDDGARVRAQSVVGGFSDARLVYVAHEPPRGSGAIARNTGIQKAKGEFVAFLDDDDEWDPRKLEEQVLGLDESGEGVCAAMTSVAIYDNTTGNLVVEKPLRESGIVSIFDRTLYHSYIWTSAIMARTSALREVGGLDETFPKNQEWDLELRLSRKWKFFAIDKFYTRINVLGEDEHMGGKKNISNIIRGYEMLFAKYRDDYAKAPAALARNGINLATMYREVGDFKNMQRMFGVVWRAEPFKFVHMRHYFLSLLGEKVYGTLYKYFA